MQQNTKFLWHQHNRIWDIPITKYLEKYESSLTFWAICTNTLIFNSHIFNALQFILGQHLNFHEILFIRLSDIACRMNGKFHPRSCKRKKNAICSAIYTKIYLQCLSVGLQLNIKFHWCQHNRRWDIFIPKILVKHYNINPMRDIHQNFMCTNVCAITKYKFVSNSIH